MVLYSDSGCFDHLVLIREFRAGTSAQELPPTTVEQLAGSWEGNEATIRAEWPVPEMRPCPLEWSAADLHGVRLLPDGGFCRLPAQVSHRDAFTVEGGWLSAPDRMERLIRCYDATGAWLSASHQILTRRPT